MEVPRPLDREPRNIPRNDLDLQMMTIDSAWGSDDVSNNLRERLIDISEDGENYEEYWGLLSYFTRDIRLANLDNKQIFYCDYYLTLAGDLLNDKSIQPFMICINRVASVLDLSQSKSGFLRKQMNTITTNRNYKDELDPHKMSLLGKKTRED